MGRQLHIFTKSVDSVRESSLPSQKTPFLVDWRLLVKKCIANIGICLDLFVFLLLQFVF